MAFHWHNPRVINDLNDIGLIKVRVAQDSDEKTQSVFVSIRHFAWPSIV
jgi:RNA-binding protein YhbY